MSIEMQNASRVYALHNKLLPYLIPSLLLEFAICIVGSVGNSLVLYNYYYHFKRTTSWYLILTLAMYDLFLCAVVQPLGIWRTFVNWVFVNTTACKSFRLVQNSGILGSLWIVGNIAADRYMRVCHPFCYVKHRTIVIICAMSMLFTVPLNLPFALTIFGIQKSATSIPGLYVYECYLSYKAKGSWIQTAYNVILTVLFFAMLLSFLVFYGLVLKQVREKRPIGAKISSNKRLRFAKMSLVAHFMDSAGFSSKLIGQ